MAEIKSFKKQISSFEKLSILQAQQLYMKAISLTNAELKKLYIDKIILGTLYVISNFIERNNLDLLDGTSYDTDDLMSAFMQVWIKKINEGELLNVDNFSYIFTPAFFNEVYENVCGCSININSLFGVCANAFIDLFYSFVKLKNEEKQIRFKNLLDMIEENKDLLRLPEHHQNNLLCLFDKMYNNLNFDKNEDLILSKHKVASFIRLFINNGLFDDAILELVDYDMEDKVLNDIVSKEFVSDVDKILVDEKTRDIIHQRFGLDKSSPKTLEAIGKDYGVSREAIRCIELRALSRLSKTYKMKAYNQR